VALLTQWCQNTFPFPLAQSYYFILANGRERSSFQPMGQQQIYREIRVAGELTELLGLRLDFLREKLLKARGV